MPKYVSIDDHLSVDDLAHRYRKVTDPIERGHFQIIWLLARGKRVREVAESTGNSCQLDSNSGSPLQSGWATGTC